MLADKLQEFYDALVAIKTALIAKDVVVSKFTLDLIAGLVGQIQTQRNMGTQEVTFKQNIVTYGIKISKSEQDPTNRVTYLDNAKGMVALSNNLSNGNCNYGSWKNSWIFDKIYPVMLKNNGQIDYRLNPDDQTKKADGSASDIANINYGGNAMVCIEKFYTKFSMNGNDEEIRISNVKQDGYEAIGFVRQNGTEADRVFISMYSGIVDTNGKLRSISGYQTQQILGSIPHSHETAGKNGNGYTMSIYAIDQIFAAILTILIKSCDWETKLGEGRTNGGQFGKLDKKGSFAYDTTYRGIKTLWVEDFVLNSSSRVNWFELGLMSYDESYYSSTHSIYIAMKPPYSTTDGNGSNYTKVTNNCFYTDGYITKMNCSNSTGRYPVEVGSSRSGAEGRNIWEKNFSGNWAQAIVGGALGLWGRLLYPNSNYNQTYRLMYTPPN